MHKESNIFRDCIDLMEDNNKAPAKVIFFLLMAFLLNHHYFSICSIYLMFGLFSVSKQCSDEFVGVIYP